MKAQFKEYGLGRLESKDERDKLFPMKAALPLVLPERRFRYYYQGEFLDQGSSSECVAYSWTHWIIDGPVRHKGFIPSTHELYKAAQDDDEWPGSEYNGTSVRAGAKVLHKNGSILEYRWTTEVEDLINCLITTSPVVVGTIWTSDMFNPNSKGIIKVTGQEVGGHAYLLNGVNRDKGLFRIKNSWSRNWGKKGNAWIAFDDMSKLLLEGECCLAIEQKIF